MKIYFTPTLGSGVVRAVFDESVYLLSKAAKECDGGGVYWLKDGELLAFETDDIKEHNGVAFINIPELKIIFEVATEDGDVYVQEITEKESSFFCNRRLPTFKDS